VKDFTLNDGRITAVETDHGALPCDHAVLAAGIWSKPLMAKLGLKVPLEVERGHHLHFSAPSQLPNTPMMIAKGKFVATPMETGLRCAGTVELGSLDRSPSKAPLALITKGAKWAFPNLRYESVEEWVGFRPSTPDSLPLVGEIRGTGVHAAFGHQHVGLTGGPKTGRWVADLISGNRTNTDLSAFDANRFG
jgi:D-amino-acid dehydrogenase